MWPSDFCMQSWCLVGRVCLLCCHDSPWNSITCRRTPFRCLSNWQVKENCPSDKTALHRRSKLGAGSSALSLADRSVCIAGRRRAAVTVTRVKICVHSEHLNVSLVEVSKWAVVQAAAAGYCNSDRYFFSLIYRKISVWWVSLPWGLRVLMCKSVLSHFLLSTVTAIRFVCPLLFIKWCCLYPSALAARIGALISDWIPYRLGSGS
jgi:hypothetical protein